MQERWTTALDHVERILSTMKLGDMLEILIIAFLVYHILMWIQASRAWYLLKGLIVIGGFLLVSWALDMHTILWLALNIAPFAVTAIVVVLQPEIRRALEELGKRNVLRSLMTFDSGKKAEAVFDEKTVNEEAIEEFDPYAIDLSSSLETDGFKDENKIRELMEVIN